MRPIRAVMWGVLTTQLGCSMGSSTLGVTPGGSQDIGLIRDIIAMGYVPDQASFTAEGLFSEHDLPLEGPACEQLICPRGAVTEHLPLDGRGSRPLAQVGFATGLDAETFSRRPLDVVGVVDISCSMDGGKLELARDALQAMVDQLDEADRMSLVVFGANARVVRPSRSMTEEQKFRMRSAIEDLSIGGSTALEDGMSRGFGQLAPEPGVESRMMLFTDARPNTGATEQSEFVRMTRAASAEGKHLTLFGTGTDLGVDLADAVGRVRGASYHYLGDDALQRLFVEEFDYLVTPVAYDFEAVFTPAASIAIDQVYGAPTDGDTGMSIAASTLFLSSREGGIAAALTGPLLEGASLARMSASWLPLDATERVHSQVDIAWQGGGPLGSSDQLGVHKIALLVDEYEALVAAAEGCDGLRESQAVLDQLDATIERLDTEALALSDGPLGDEADLMRQLRANVVSGFCAESEVYLE